MKLPGDSYHRPDHYQTYPDPHRGIEVRIHPVMPPCRRLRGAQRRILNRVSRATSVVIVSLLTLARMPAMRRRSCLPYEEALRQAVAQIADYVDSLSQRSHH